MKFLIDECLSHTYVADFAARGFHDTFHPIHIGLRRARDDQLLAKAVAEDRILISANAKDFRKLLSRSPIRPSVSTCSFVASSLLGLGDETKAAPWTRWCCALPPI